MSTVFYPEIKGAQDIKGVVDSGGKVYDLPVGSSIEIDNPIKLDWFTRLFPFLKVDPKATNPKGLADKDDIEEGELVEESYVNVDDLSWNDLRAYAKGEGVATNQKKEEIIKQLKELHKVGNDEVLKVLIEN